MVPNHSPQTRSNRQGRPRPAGNSRTGVELLPQENLYLVYDVFSKLVKNYGDINFVKFELWILIMSIFSFEYA